MRSIIAENSVLLKDDKWVQLRKIVAPEHRIKGYTYSHEVRSDGELVAFLLYKTDSSKLEFLLRKEAVPCWELDKPIFCCFTGGIDKGMNPLETAVKECKEEAGYEIPKEEINNRVKNLGTSFGIKSSDTVYHLFGIDVTNFEPEHIKDLYVETDLEKASTNEWIELHDLRKQEILDPFVYMLAWKIYHL